MPYLNFKSNAPKYLEQQDHSDMKSLDMKRKRLNIIWKNSTLRGASYTANRFSGWFALLFSNDQH